jgi:hypothetical protein
MNSRFFKMAFLPRGGYILRAKEAPIDIYRDFSYGHGTKIDAFAFDSSDLLQEAPNVGILELK